jgi:hypothetical protein
MDPMTLALLGGGLLIKSYGQFRANMAQADAEAANASFYREQAEFAAKAGERAVLIHDRESVVLYGEQASGFAKAGVSSSNSSLFMAKEMLFRQEESAAIKAETDMNVRLAMLRADQSEREADSLRDPLTNALQFGSNAFQTAASIL